MTVLLHGSCSAPEKPEQSRARQGWGDTHRDRVQQDGLRALRCAVIGIKPTGRRLETLTAAAVVIVVVVVVESRGSSAACAPLCAPERTCFAPCAGQKSTPSSSRERSDPAVINKHGFRFKLRDSQLQQPQTDL